MEKFLHHFLTLGCLWFCFDGFAQTNLRPIIQQSGHISISVDGLGTVIAGGGNIQVSKPAGATVRNAYFFASSHNLTGGSEIFDGDILLNNQAVNWDLREFNGLTLDPTFFHNVFADVTAIVKPTIDAAAPGMIDLPVVEQNTADVNGTILAVIFDDPNQTSAKGIVLFFGGQATTGDTFQIDLSEPFEPGEPVTLGIGVGHGFQTTTGTPMVNLIDVNGNRLTSSAGGEDDGESTNGALITVGGIGDSADNPEPFAPSTHFRTDDELYSLNPFLQSGDTQVEIFSVNPTDDDDIFFAYLVTSSPAAILPDVDPPGPTSLLGDLNPNLPTIILTHGLQAEGTGPQDLWSGFAETQAGGLIRAQLSDEQVNVVQYIWNEAFQPTGCVIGVPTRDGYVAAQRNTVNAGTRLAQLLLGSLGANYQQPVHFIGHSLGTAVNAYAVNALTQQASQIPQIQFTALDRPDRVGIICGLTERDEAIFGFDRDFFSRVLPMDHPGLIVDNYFALDGAGVGDVATGTMVYNHLPPTGLIDSNRIDDVIFGDEGFDNSHSGVQQWYRWTMNPVNPIPDGTTVCNGDLFETPPPGFGPSLDPCEEGWFWSLNQNPGSFPEPNGEAPAIEVAIPVEPSTVLDFGCGVNISANQVTTVTCPEKAERFVVQRSGLRGTNENWYVAFDVQVVEAASLEFSYVFNEPGDGDYAAVILDNDPIWVVTGENAIPGVTTHSGKISLGNAIGLHRITIGLFSAGGAQTANFEIKDLVINSSSFEAFLSAWPEQTNALDLVEKVNTLQ